MLNPKSPGGQIESQVQALLHRIGQLQKQLATALQEKSDLETILATVTDHSDQVLSDIQQEKTDLEILLETTTEHSSQLEFVLQSQVEEERRQREEQFQLMAAATPVGLLISQVADGRILYANETSGKLVALTPAELLNYQTTDFYTDQQARSLLVEEAIRRGKFQGEMLFKRSDGTSFWALVSMCPFRFQGVDALLTALTDISDRKQAEEALRLAESKYRGIFENAVEGIFRTSLQGRFLEVNPAMATMFGYTSPQEMVEAITSISHQIYVDPERYREFELALALRDEIKDFEYQVHHRDGSSFWVSEWARVVRDDQGNVLYYEGSCIDITKRKQQEDSLKQQLRELQIVIDHNKRAKEVAEIEQTDYFQWLMQEADNLRNRDG